MPIVILGCHSLAVEINKNAQIAPKSAVTVPISRFGSTQMNLKLVILILGILVAFGCQAEKQASLPDYLVGTWKTKDSKYAGLYFQIENDRIIFSKADGSVDSYTISRFENSGTDKIVSTLLYLDGEGQQLKFAFYYQPKDAGKIRFKHQIDILWTKEKQ